VASQPDKHGNDLLSQVKVRAGVGGLTAEQDELLLQAYRKGYRSFLASALDYNAKLDQYDLSQPSHSPRQSTDAKHPQSTDTPPDVVAYDTTVQDDLKEGQRGELWAAKTVSKKPMR
jgi:hypothetical protein